MANTICWFEIYVKDIDRAKKFYSDVLHTSFVDIAPPGDANDEMLMAFFDGGTNNSQNDVSGALVQMPGSSQEQTSGLNTIVYFPCQDCAIELSRVTAAGGKIYQEKTNLGEHGFCSLAVDTEGNIIGFYSQQ